MEEFPKLNNNEKRVNYELDIEGIKIPCWKENFSYPERIQNETQIEGYERIRIKWDDFFEYMKKDLGVEVSLSSKDMNDQRNKNDFKTIYEKKFNDVLEKSARKKGRVDGRGNTESYKVEQEFINKFFAGFSNKKFPSTTYNHALHGNDTYAIDSIEHKDFFDDKALLGKVDTLSRHWQMRDQSLRLIIDENNNVIFHGTLRKLHTGDTYGVTDGANQKNPYYIAGARSKESNVSSMDSFGAEGPFEEGKILFNSMEEFDESFKKYIFLDSVGGLNIEAGEVWWDPHSNLFKPVFGFDRTEPPFSDYIKKIDRLYGELPQEMIGVTNKDNISCIEKYDGNEFKKHAKWKGHPYLPAMFGNTGLPELRWGHCKYASIPTKDSLNLLTIKHIEKKTEN